MPIAPTKIIVSRETTYITGPLNADGTVNYVAYLDEKFSRGVTPENNAVVPLIRALGPDVLEGKARDAFYARLGIAPLPEYGDYFIPLHMRVVKARRAHADLFVSIHADSYINSRASGTSVFALSEHGATSAAARWLAKNENEADLIGGVNIDPKDPYLARTLLDLSQTATISDSLKLGKYVLGQLGDVNNLHRGFVEQAGFAVLKAPDIPSILVETAFISNPKGERHLRNPQFREQIAHAIFDGIKRYFAQHPPLARPRIAQAD